MSFTYRAGSSTPTLAGLAEIAGIRINGGNDGTYDGSFISEHLAGIIDTPPVRPNVSDLPQDHGAYAGPLFYGPRDIEIAGRIKVASPYDVPQARDYIKTALALVTPDTAWTLVTNMPGWATRRQCVVKINGPVVFEEPETVRRKGITRDFTIPLLAADPILYDADNLRTFTFPMDNTHHTITGAGAMPVPFMARFHGPWNTAASLIDNVSGVKITLTMDATSSEYVDVDLTVPGDPVATKSDGTNVTGVTDSLLREVAPAANDWRAAGSSGTTGASLVTVTWRDGWN